jgi:hypothetical protein
MQAKTTEKAGSTIGGQGARLKVKTGVKAGAHLSGSGACRKAGGNGL